jgi:flavin-dependent dehydrogenase
MSNYYDVVIVGAGFAGLECAKNLVGSGLKVLILEKK